MTTTLFLNTIQKVSGTLFHPNVNEEQQERATKKDGRGAGGERTHVHPSRWFHSIEYSITFPA